MLGSSNSIACANIMLNAAVAETLQQFADELEGGEDFNATLQALIHKTIKEHKRIIFNGNGYDDEWIEEATKVRGLSNYRTTPDAMPHLLDEKNVKMLTSLKVFSEAELHSRCEIMLENYSKTVLIEANTMVEMAQREILPAIVAYSSELAQAVAAKKAVSESVACTYETKLIQKLSTASDQISVFTKELEDAIIQIADIAETVEQSFYIRDVILPKMTSLRVVCDEAEQCTASKYWPFPTYGELLFGVR